MKLAASLFHVEAKDIFNAIESIIFICYWQRVYILEVGCHNAFAKLMKDFGTVHWWPFLTYEKFFCNVKKTKKVMPPKLRWIKSVFTLTIENTFHQMFVIFIWKVIGNQKWMCFLVPWHYHLSKLMILPSFSSEKSILSLKNTLMFNFIEIL